MKKLLSMVMLLALTLSLFGCSTPNGNSGKDNSSTDNGHKDDGLVSVWLVTSITSYEADGSNGFNRKTYTYTDKGLPLTMTNDSGPVEEFYNEELGLYEYIRQPFDGNIDSYVEYFYNEQGDYLYYAQTRKTFNINGEETSSDYFADGKDANYTYHYDANGRVEYADIYPSLIGGGHGDEPYGAMRYCYDDSGNLIEIYYESLTDEKTKWNYDFRYDDQGRLIGSTVRPQEACRYYQYEYDNAGRLTYLSLSMGYHQTPLDDLHVSESSYNGGNTALSLMGETSFVYDEDGNLTARGNTTCTYKDGKLSTVTYKDGNQYVYVDDEKDADPDAITLVRDKHGNVVKILYGDDGYTEYIYKEFRLTEEEAIKCRNIQLTQSRIDPFGNNAYNHWIPFTPGVHIGCLPALPSTVLHFTDVLESNY